MFLSPQIPFRINDETPGNQTDLRPLVDDHWLIDTEVRFHIMARKSQWHLSMLYIDVRNSLKFICRKIDVYHSEKKAILYAQILQRGIRKDARGILKTKDDDFHFCEN